MAVRDVDSDYTAAYLAEYQTYLGAGLIDRAAAVAAELRARGVDIPDPVPADDGSEPPADPAADPAADPDNKEPGVENKAATGEVEKTVPASSTPAGVELKSQAAAARAAAKAAPKAPAKAGD